MSRLAYTSLRNWIHTNWTFSNRDFALRILEQIKNMQAVDTSAGKAVIIDAMRKKNGICLISL